MTPELERLLTAVEEVLEAWYDPACGEPCSSREPGLLAVEEVEFFELGKAFAAYRKSAGAEPSPEGDASPDWSAA